MSYDVVSEFPVEEIVFLSHQLERERRHDVERLRFADVHAVFHRF